MDVETLTFNVFIVIVIMISRPSKPIERLNMKSTCKATYAWAKVWIKDIHQYCCKSVGEGLCSGLPILASGMIYIYLYTLFESHPLKIIAQITLLPLGMVHLALGAIIFDRIIILFCEDLQKISDRTGNN